MAGPVVTAPIAIKQGADLTILIEITDDGVGVDLSNNNVTGLIKDRIGGATLLDLASDPATVTFPADGQCLIQVPASLTEALTPRLPTLGEQPFGVYDIKAADKTSEAAEYWIQGDVTLTAQVTP